MRKVNQEYRVHAGGSTSWFFSFYRNIYLADNLKDFFENNQSGNMILPNPLVIVPNVMAEVSQNDFYIFYDDSAKFAEIGPTIRIPQIGRPIDELINGDRLYDLLFECRMLDTKLRIAAMKSSDLESEVNVYFQDPMLLWD